MSLFWEYYGNRIQAKYFYTHSNMDKKKNKRTKSKTQSDGHGRSSVKKKTAEVTTEKEERERLEAANILSSLKFMAPHSSDVQTPDSTSGNDTNSTGTKMTYFPSSSTTGISTQSTPSVVSQGRLPMAGGSVAALTIIPPALLNQLSQLQTVMSQSGVQTINPQQLLSLLNMQVKPSVKAQMKGSKVPSVVNTASTSKLPLTLNPVKTINKTVATALRQAVTQNNVSKLNPDTTVMKSIKEKIQKKNSDEETNSANSNPENDATTGDKTDPVDKTDAASKKKESVENSLPLKKRRLVSLLEAPSQDLGTTRLSNLTTDVQMENILNLARDYPDPSAHQVQSSQKNPSITNALTEGYKPVSFDPRTSLLVLSDLKAALTPDEDGDLPIHIAVVHENTELVKKFIDIMAMSGKSVDRYNKLQQTPLHLAVLVNKPDIVHALLLANADPNLVDRNGCTSIHIAITKGFFQCLQKVFAVSRKRVEVNTRNYEGYSPLHTCVELGDFKSMKFLNENGAPTYLNLNIQDGKAGRSVLFYATEYKQGQMVDYLIQCGVNVDLQNYAGVSALMTAQAAGYDSITHLLTRALETQKITDDSFVPQPKKVPIAPIPSKTKLIVPDSPLIRSRSGSMSFEGKPASVSRTSSTSSSSPMDLSLHRKNQSPNGPARRSKQNSIDAEMTDRISEVDKLASKVNKEKHAQIIAALEGRSLSNLQRTLPLPLPDESNTYSLTDILSLKQVTIKQEPPDYKESVKQSVEQNMDTDTNRDDALSKYDKGTNLDKDWILSRSGASNTRQNTTPVLQKYTPSDSPGFTDMDTQDSPRMPVLSRAVSLTDKSQGGMIMQDNIVPDAPSSSQNVGMKNKGSHIPVDFDSDPNTLTGSQGFDTSASSSADKSVEIAMEVDTDIDCSESIETTTQSRKDVENSTREFEFLDGQSERSPMTENGNSDSDMDINAIEMDAEEGEDEEMEGSLVIDENGPEQNTTTDGVLQESDNNVSDCDNDKQDSLQASEKAEQCDLIGTSGQSYSDKDGIGKDSEPISHDDDDDTSESDNEAQKLEYDVDKYSKGIPELCNKHRQNQDSLRKIDNTVKEPSGISKRNEVKVFETRKNDNGVEKSNNSEKIDVPIVKKVIELNSVKSIERNIDKLNEDVQSVSDLDHEDKVIPPDRNHAGKTSDIETVFPTAHPRTLYIQDKDGYKPIKIFIDDSVESSLVLQRVLGQASVISNLQSQTLPVGNFEGQQSESANPVQLPVTTGTPGKTNVSANIPAKNTSVSVDEVNSSKQMHDSNKTIVEKAEISTVKSAQIENLLQEMGKRMSFSESMINSVKKVDESHGASKLTHVDCKESSATLPLTKKLKNRTASGSTGSGVGSEIIDHEIKRDETKGNINSTNSNEPKEQCPKTVTDSKSANSPLKANLSHKPITGTSILSSQKPSTATSLSVTQKSSPTTSSSTTRQQGPSVAAPQSKVTSFLQNRVTVSTSEGTLTWVNPDIKSRLSKALQSPQRKQAGKVASPGQDTELNYSVSGAPAGTNSVEGQLNIVQTAVVSDMRQQS